MLFNKAISLKNEIKSALYVNTDSLLLGSFIYFIFFLIYLETSPKLKNIWLRCNSENILKICPSGIRSMLSKPFSNIYFWYPRFWDINYYAGAYIFSNILNKYNII